MERKSESKILPLYLRNAPMYRNPESMDVRNFYGGDLQGVLDKMDYLQDLGVDVIYFNPPLIIEEADMDFVTDIALECAKEILR